MSGHGWAYSDDHCKGGYECGEKSNYSIKKDFHRCEVCTKVQQNCYKSTKT